MRLLDRREVRCAASTSSCHEAGVLLGYRCAAGGSIMVVMVVMVVIHHAALRRIVMLK